MCSFAVQRQCATHWIEKKSLCEQETPSISEGRFLFIDFQDLNGSSRARIYTRKSDHTLT
jgi:hypothetical protein